MARSWETLRRDQQEILNSYREARRASPLAATPSPNPTAAGELCYGRVIEVVLSDPVLGPHLVIMRQAWTGTPPVPADAGVTGLRCYPAPSHTVADFAANQFVRLVILPGAALAEPLT